MKNYVPQLFDFIHQSPTSAHAVHAACQMLDQAGFTRLQESQPWRLEPGGKYYLTRGLTSVMAFRYPSAAFRGFSIVASHSDSPSFRVKGQPEMRVEDRYTKLNTEVYGVPLLNPWFDRPLSVAGRLAVRTGEGMRTALTDVDRDLLVIPSLAIHLNRDANNGKKLDAQKDTLPLLGGSEADLLALAAEASGVEKGDILSYDLYLYNRAPGASIGPDGEFICAPRLDDLECAFSSLQAFLQAENGENCTVCAIFDNEETGSSTRQGADSTLLSDLLTRICLAAGKGEEERLLALQASFMLSADNAHAVHPDYPDKADPTNRCYMNGGVVVKHGVRYATGPVSAGVFKKICQDAAVPVQDFYNHSSIPAGGTLGNISISHVSIPTVDVGLAQLAMHSPYETAGRDDLSHMVDAMAAFYGSAILCGGDGQYTLRPAQVAPLDPGPAAEPKPEPRAEPQPEPVPPQPEAVVPAPAVQAAKPEAPEKADIAPAAAPPAAKAVQKEKGAEGKPVARSIEEKPGWQKETVFYQIYPIGFCGAPLQNDGKTVSRILKVRDWVPHLQKLHVGAVYFSPVFESDAHGYDTRDYRKIDCRLGTNEDFKQVCKSLHDGGIRVVLDGVFNHVGRGFWAFQDVLKNRERSPYKDWFYVNFGGNSQYNDGLWYEGWEGAFDLVKLNLKNPQVVDHLLQSVGQWMEEFQIDGLRLDVAYMVDQDFMRTLRRFCRERRPDFFLLGEMIHGDYHRIMNPDMLDSATNYECYKGLYSSFNTLNMFEIAHSLNRQFGPEGWTLYKGEHLLSFADNHDVSRIHSILTDKNQIKPLYAVVYGMPGIPCVYYGSEWGADGSKSDGDPALRPSFDAPVENDLTEFLGRLGRVKAESPALCYGDFKNETLLNKQWVMRRSCPEETVLVAVNAEGSGFNINCNYHGPATELLSGERRELNGCIELEPYGVKIYRLG